MAKVLPEQAMQIEFLRKQGFGYRQIAVDLNLPRDTVRYYCKKHDLAGNAKEAYTSAKGVICPQCGKRLRQPETGRKRVFCSDACKNKWWKTNRKLIPRPLGSCEEIACAYCGKPILDYSTSSPSIGYNLGEVLFYHQKAQKPCNHGAFEPSLFLGVG